MKEGRHRVILQELDQQGVVSVKKLKELLVLYNFIPQIYYTTIYSFWKIKNNIFLIFVKYCLTLFYLCSIIKLYKTKGV